MDNGEWDSMKPEDLDELDRAILDYLKEGRNGEEPWGIATPAVVRAALEERGVEMLPSRETINVRLRRMQLAEHLENRYGKGMYVFVNDPREREREENSDKPK